MILWFFFLFEWKSSCQYVIWMYSECKVFGDGELWATYFHLWRQIRWFVMVKKELTDLRRAHPLSERHISGLAISVVERGSYICGGNTERIKSNIEIYPSLGRNVKQDKLSRVIYLNSFFAECPIGITVNT